MLNMAPNQQATNEMVAATSVACAKACLLHMHILHERSIRDATHMRSQHCDVLHRPVYQ